MKKLNYRNTIYIILIMSCFSMQSCSVGGLLIGSVMDSADDTNNDLAMIEGNGWISPESTKYNVRIRLTNGNSVYGNYHGEDIYRQGEVETGIVLIMVGKTIKRIPAERIEYTFIYREKKSKAMSGVAIGMSIDMMILLGILSSGGFGLGLGSGWFHL